MSDKNFHFYYNPFLRVQHTIFAKKNECEREGEKNIQKFLLNGPISLNTRKL